MSSEDGTRPRSGLADRAAQWALPLAALCGSFYPLLLPPSYAALLSGFTAVPGTAAAVVIGAAAAVAVRAAPRSPGRPLVALVALVAADAVLRAPGPLTAVTLYLAAVHGRSRPVAAVAVGMTVLCVLPRPGLEWGSSLGNAPLFVWLPLALGAWSAARARAVSALRERAERLDREQTALAARARAEERTRIARDMHDVVAHRVSLIVLRAGALEVSASDRATADEAELIRRAGQDALSQLSHVVGVLSHAGAGASDEPGTPESAHSPPTLAHLDELVDRSRSAGVPVELHGMAGHESEAADVVEEHTAYRVVQEALTNVHKHAGGAPTRVTVRREAGTIEITVENTAPARTPMDLPGAGVGLMGLRKRVEALGGDFRAGPTAPGGFRVWARLPT